MKAVVYNKPGDVSVENVTDPAIKDGRDAIVRVTKSAVCGSDLHFYRGVVPMDEGFVVGHEFMGVVEDAGKDARGLKKGDRVVAPFWVSCGGCANCHNHFPTSCTGGGGCFGFGEAFGGYGGGQAEFVRVALADTTLEKVPESVEDEKLLFLGDVFSTAYFCAEWADIKPGGVVVVFGDGPLGLLATASARLFSPSKVITVGHHDYRLGMAKSAGADFVINSSNEDPAERVMEITGGLGADSACECIGSESALLETFKVVRPGGVISFIGLFLEPVAIPMLDFYLKNFTLRGGVCPAKNYISKLLPLVESGRVDPSFIISHDLPLSDTPKGYELMDKRMENAVKVVLTP
ncbi:MAG: alcohol dehydrogenase catalytic domain-containing protein [Candidatus Dadabacteria bacterium]|nr:alcohol dehydrogenase catalytic domain-containing protein [Candidatus Dadabacteria bacterium]